VAVITTPQNQPVSHLCCTLHLLFVPLLLIAACTDTGLSPLPSPPSGPYRLGSGDKVQLIVFGEGELSKEYPVNDAGNISIPLVGNVPVNGKTIVEVEAAIKEALNKGIVRDATVGVHIAAYRPFYILGEVAKPGQYSYVFGMNVLTAVAIAGGFTLRADKDDMTISRVIDNGSIEGAAKQTTKIEPGDTIYVRERYF
jgi:polysaccharide export outer membrane protein